MVCFPPCKINIGLNVVGRRSDGYHDIYTSFYPVPWTDILEIIPSEEVTTFTRSGLDIPGTADSNLCLKAYRLLKKDFPLKPVRIYLHKIIPIGAGLGGGSSDAAYVLKMLNDIFVLKLSVAQLQSYASQLGSDCSFFITDTPMIGSGRGEILSGLQLNLKGKFVVIVKPDIHISTAEAYAGVTPHAATVDLKEVLEQRPLSAWRETVCNDFEVSVFKRHPVIGTIKKQLYDNGARYASMSGSGSSVFGIFEKDTDLQGEFKDFTYWSGFL